MQEAIRSLASAVLVTFPSTALAAFRGRAAPGSGQAAPAVLRRALAFIDDNAHLPIGLADIAAAARIGPSGLQELFRRHQDRTPLDHLRRVRLVRAHAELQAADPLRADAAAIVAAVAARWGFADPFRFAVQYRQVFGCAPTETLTGAGAPGQRGFTAEDVTRMRARANDARVRARDAHARATQRHEEAVQTRLRVGQLREERGPHPPDEPR